MGNRNTNRPETEKPKKGRRPLKDLFTDYYKTSREYAQDNEARSKESGHTISMKKSEIFMITVIVLGLIGILIKYVILK